MKVAIVFNHPYQGSFCNAILETVTRTLKVGGHETDVLHLDNDQFNPVMTAADLKGFVDGAPVDPQVLAYRSRLEKADTPSLIYRLVFGNAIKKALFTGTFWKMGYRNRKWISFNMVKFVSDEKRQGWLTKLEKHFSRLGADTRCTTSEQPYATMYA